MKLNNLGLKCCLIGLLILGLSLSGCTGGSGSGKGKVTIQFMHSSVEQDRLATITKLINKFEKENPNIDVKQVPVEENNYNTKIITLAKSGKLPEVLEVGQDYARVMDKDRLIDNSAVSKIIKEVGKDEYYQGALNLVRTQNGKSYTGVPITGWVQGIWYNKQALRSKGFSEPQNWNDLLKIAKAFTNKNTKHYGIGLPTVEGEFSEQAFSQFALSNNANILDNKGNVVIKSSKMKEAISYYKELSKYTMPGSNDTTEVSDAFMNKTVPMIVYSTYILPSVYKNGNAKNIGFAIPKNKTKAVYGTVSALTITSGLSNAQKTAAKKFVRFMSQPENTTEWVLMSPGGAQPVNKEVVENKKYQNNKIIKSFGKLSLEIARSYNNIQVFGLVNGKNFSKMGDITSSGAISKLVNGVTVGNDNINSAVNDANRLITSTLNK